MRSLVTFEFEHGETTDPLGYFLEHVATMPLPAGLTMTDWQVRVDIPACFVLDSES